MNSKTLGIVLVILGIVLYLANIGLLEGEFLLVAVGAAFIIGYYRSGHRVGFLIAGSVIVAVGLFAWLDRWLPGGEHGYLFFVFLALAFAAVYLVDMAAGGRAGWAVYPALALAAFAVFVFVAESGFSLPPALSMWVWPVLLILAGAYLLFSRR